MTASLTSSMGKVEGKATHPHTNSRMVKKTARYFQTQRVGTSFEENLVERFYRKWERVRE